MKITGIFKNLAKAKGLSIKLLTRDGEIIGKTKKVKKNKFTLSIATPSKNEEKIGAVNVAIIDSNGNKSNFKSHGKGVDLSPNKQTFTFNLNFIKKKARLKIKLDTEAAGKPESTWLLGEIRSLKTSGVSPHIETSGSGYKLAYPAGGFTKIDDLNNSFQLSNRGKLDRISDLTVVTSGDGVRRGYYVELNPATKEKEIFTAEISEDWLTLRKPSSTGITDGGSMAWGVPDAVRLPDGRVRLYWVEDPPAGGRDHREWIVSATSTDTSGTSFKKDPGQRTTGGYVDFEVLQAKKGDWVAVMSSTPETLPNQPQGLFVGTSKDGLGWDVNPKNLAPKSMSYLDPTGVAIGPDQWQLVLARSTNSLGDRDYTLVQTTLTIS